MTGNLPSRKQCTTLQGSQRPPTTLTEWKEKFSTPSRLMEIYSSKNWIYALDNPKGAYMNFTPTLLDISKMFGDKVMIEWVTRNVMAIWYVKPDTNPMIYQQTIAWANMWSRMNKHFTIGELTLFFARCQAGKYYLGNHLDLTRIGGVFEEKFKPERMVELNRYIAEKNNAERKRQEEEDALEVITYEQYKTLNPNFDPNGALARLLGGDIRQNK